MAASLSLRPSGASHLAAMYFGVLAGTGMIRHGIGEIVQGNVPPAGSIFESWSIGPIARHMDGEPAFSLVPNLLATGILAVLVGTAVMVWALLMTGRMRGGAGLALLSVAAFLLGGGFGPPMTGLLAGITGLGAGGSFTWPRIPGIRWMLASLWPWVFGIAALNGFFLFIGSLVLVCVFEMDNAALFLNSFFLAVLAFPPLILTGLAADAEKRASA